MQYLNRFRECVTGLLPCCTVFSAAAQAAGLCPEGECWRCQALLVIRICFRSPVPLPIGGGSTTPSGPVSNDLCAEEDDSFGRVMAGCLEAPLGVVRVAFAVGGAEELTLGAWLVVMGDSISCYDGHSIVLRLWVSLLLCLSTRCIGFGVVPVVRLVLRTLATGCLVG